MKYPKFFEDIETIKLQDNLSNFLGTFENGIVEFSYLDIVKSAGHSCPTVAGAYIMTFVALKELYKEQIPKRGEIAVSFKDDLKDGTIGVTSNVISQITGSTEISGFKGLNGNFQRFNLMKFNEKIKGTIKFQRLDTCKTIEIIYNPNLVAPNPLISALMKKILNNEATKEEKIKFGILWQERVKNIFNNIERVIKIVI